MKKLSDYKKELAGKKCRWCNRDLSHGEIDHYDHDGGYPVEGFDLKQWLYVTCKCKYQWALHKLGIKP